MSCSASLVTVTQVGRSCCRLVFTFLLCFHLKAAIWLLVSLGVNIEDAEKEEIRLSLWCSVLNC